jgi:hypothetical protein
MKKQSTSVIAFLDLLGTTHFAKADATIYHEHLVSFKTALLSRASLLKNTGKVFLFSDCAYVMCSDVRIILEYLREVRAVLLLEHIYIQAAIEPGELSPVQIGTQGGDTVSGTIFGPDVAPLYARQHALKGAAIRVSDDLADRRGIKAYCVMSCHLPNPTNSVAECFWDIRYPQDNISRKQLENVLADCINAKSTQRSAGTYYISVLISMIRSVDWKSVNLNARVSENDTGARHLYELLIRGEFNRHFGDLRGVEYVFYALLDEVYKGCERKPVFEEIRRYVATRPRLLRRIESVPPKLLDNKSRQKFLASTLVWSRLSDQPILIKRQRNVEPKS